MEEGISFAIASVEGHPAGRQVVVDFVDVAELDGVGEVVGEGGDVRVTKVPSTSWVHSTGAEACWGFADGVCPAVLADVGI